MAEVNFLVKKGLTVPKGSATTPAIIFDAGDTNTGIYSPGADQVAISTNGTAQLTTTTSGITSALPLDVPPGSASAPTLTFTGDTNTGIYSPGADQVAISTNGTGRLFVDASGRVLTGTSSSRSQGQALQVEGIDFPTSSFLLTRNQANSTSSVFTFLKTRGTTIGSNTIVQAGDRLGRLEFQGADGTSGNIAAQIEVFADSTPGTGSVPGYLVFSTTASSASSPTERLRITSDGKVGLGTSSPYSRLTVVPSAPTPTTPAAANQITIGEASQNSGYRLQLGYLFDTLGRGSIQSYDNNNPGSLILNGAGGNVGVGTTSPGALLDVRPTSGNIGFQIAVEGAGGIFTTIYDNGGLYSLAFTGNTSPIVLAGAGTSSSIPYALFTNNTERARIDSSGRLLVGTSSLLTPINSVKQEIGNGNLAITSFQANAFAYQIGFTKSRSTSAIGTIVQSGDELGNIDWWADDGTSTAKQAARIQVFVDGTPGANDMPGRLVFSTTADGASSPTERMRILESGRIWFGNTSSLGNYKYHLPYTGSSTNGLILRTTDATGNPNAIGFEYQTTAVGSISVTSTTTTYATTSDYRAKENVTAVTDGITRLQQLKPSRFNFIADPTKTVDGFLAHEAAEVVPECVTGEKDAVDDDGNPIYQGIDQSKLVPLLTAALQEAVAKIESLEARLTAAGI